MDVSLRPATQDDVSKVAAIEAQVQPQVSAWIPRQFEEELAKSYSRFLVLTDDESDETVVGYIVYWLMGEECQILTLAVNLQHRGLGYGQALVQQAIRDAVQGACKRVVLEVRKSNEAAIQLYHRNQLLITHVRKGFYSDGEDAYQMVLELGG
jgi:ribosomal-protein-alanine N-acetyltransferase